jgi:hypothetical protein
MSKSASNKVAVVTSTGGKKGKLQFSPITLDEKYAKKWNESGSGFFCLTIDEKLVSESLYRKGGLGGKWQDGYMMILKYVEDMYDKNLTKDMTHAKRHHLDARSCIINKQGKEMFVQDGGIDHAYLQGGVVYSVGDGYYNIETGELYCRSYSRKLESDEFIFLDISWDVEKKSFKGGVMKINKKDGSFEVFPKK